MAAKSSSSVREVWDFFLQMVANHRQTGAVAPSSRHLARLMADLPNLEASREILEIGPGTGVFTRMLANRIPPTTRLTLVEKNEQFVRILQREFPSLGIVMGCATELQRHFGKLGIARADAVVSGLPWASMPPALQDAILEQIQLVLNPGGTFATFAYFGPHLLPAGRRFRQRLESFFPEIRRSRVELRNLPPAFVYYATNTQA